MGKPVPPPPPALAGLGKNVAPDASVTTSHDLDAGRSPSLVNDRRAAWKRNDLRWLSPAALPHWIELAWDERKTITAARILSGYWSNGKASDPLSSFLLQYHDGERWCAVARTETAENQEIDWLRTFEAVTASRVRVYVRDTPGKISRIWEIELYEASGR